MSFNNNNTNTNINTTANYQSQGNISSITTKNPTPQGPNEANNPNEINMVNYTNTNKEHMVNINKNQATIIPTHNENDEKHIELIKNKESIEITEGELLENREFILRQLRKEKEQPNTFKKLIEKKYKNYTGKIQIYNPTERSKKDKKI